MADGMVTGRMAAAKKEAGNRVLEELGLNASQAINQMYDFLIKERTLPFVTQDEVKLDAERVKEARAFVRSIPRKNAFYALTDDEIKRAKMARRYDVGLPGGESS